MVKIRLTRTGKKHHASYRIIVADSVSKRDGKYIEKIGYYEPILKKLEFDKDKLHSWLSKGAQPTDIVKKLLKI
ncbi:MAG: 30S ribosomal protein S16 [Patescibacteria group bacterium]|jgi:small subunit ribosomal protein S16